MALAGVRHGNASQTEVERRLGPRKFATCRHFLQVLEAVFEDRPLPAVPEMAEAEVQQRIRQTTMSIVALYEEHGDKLT